MAKAKKWLGIVAGLALPVAGVCGADGLAALPPAGGHKADIVVCQQLPHGKASAALNEGINLFGKTDYEGAAECFRQAQTGYNDLLPDQQKLLNDFQAYNTNALRRRAEVADLLRQAETAEREGRGLAAADLAQKALGNQYASPNDKKKAQEIIGRVRGTPGAPGAGSVVANGKLGEARKLFADGNLDGAEQLAHEAERAHAVPGPGESTPQQLLAEITRTRQDPAALLTLARRAFVRGDFDRAEYLAKESRRVEPLWSTHMWGDSPSKVLDDCAAGRKKAAEKPIKMATDPKPGDTPPVVAAQGMTPPKKPDPLPPPPDEKKNAAVVEQAQTLLKQGRQALREGQLDKAEDCARKADALKPNLGWWADDTPAKLLADVQTAKATRGTTTAAKPPVDVKTAPNADPRAILRQAHEAFDAGKFDDAIALAQKAKTAPGAKDTWGLLDFDTPDKLINEVNKARTKHNAEEADKLLAEGRKLLEQAHQDEKHRGELLDEAERKALKAGELRNGNYSVWDIGDRPAKLLSDVRDYRKEGRVKSVPVVPPPGGLIAENNGAGRIPTAPPDDANIQRARKMMNDARSAARAGDTTTAFNLIGEVEKMNLPAEKLGSDSPSVVRRELAAAAVSRNPAVAATDEANIQRARRLMTDARSAAREGRMADANNFVVMVEGMKLPDDKLGSDSPAMVRRELASLSQPRPTFDGPPPPTPVGNPAFVDRTGNGTARLLVTEARRLQSQNQFLEARARLLQAQGLHANFGPNEDTPEKALLDVAGTARRYIDHLETLADDNVRRGVSDPQLYAKAGEQLAQAQTLARGFQLDTNLLDRKLAWVQQTRGSNVAQTGGYVAKATDGGPQADGQKLLDQARLEIRAGNLGPARRLIEQVYAGNYGLKVDAENLLRSLDIEDYIQKSKEQQRTFEAGRHAFNRGDYQLAGRILRTLDVKKLTPDQQAQMREIMKTPEMQPDRFPDAVVKTGGIAPDGTQNVNDNLPTGDSSREADFLKQTASLQNVKFQKMRDQEINATKEARQAAEKGDTERAVQILQDYLSELPRSGLDPDKMALVRRPVEAKLTQYRTLDAQKRIEDESKNVTRVGKYNHDQKVLAQANKEQKFKELIDKFNGLYKQAKYREAEMYALQAQELDPDNPIAGACVQIAHRSMAVDEFKKIKDKKEDMFRRGGNAAEDEGHFVDMSNPITSEDWTKDIRRHTPFDKVIGPPRTEKDREIERRLEEPFSLNFNNMPLKQVADLLANEHGFPVVLDVPALTQKGIDPGDSVSFKVDNMRLKYGLKYMLKNMHLTYLIRDEALIITTPDAARGNLIRKPYPVAELIVPVPDGQTQELIPHMGSSSPPPGMAGPSPTPAPVTGPMTLTQGTPTGSASNGFGSGAPPMSNGSWDGKQAPNATREDELIKLIENTIEPHSWASMGGPGTIDYYPQTMTLIINQTPDIIEQIDDLLAALRRLQDAEVAVEIRLISIAEGFYERIGVDFNVNIVNDKGTQKFQPMITSGQFKPAGFINDFTPDKFLSGLTPAGTFTSDLGIPIRNSSFGMAIPPFGGFPNVPGGNGGIGLGLAFLSDIQVFMYLEAAQGDQRTNVMQAPKLTMFNGQNATLTVADQQSFVTGGSVTVVNGQPVFVPQTQQFGTGASISVQPVISADRRFVRMNFSGVGGGIQLTNLASAVVPLFPIVQLVPTVLDGGITTQPVAFTQFFQQPVFNQVSVVTTVMVPDGGTVLLGGLKRLSEGRNEFGPPVLSKIPYLDRLFRNVGYGREVENLMMMVTPRIIINEEEEFRQTGEERQRQGQ